MKDKGRRDYTLTSAIPGPSSGVHFKRHRSSLEKIRILSSSKLGSIEICSAEANLLADHEGLGCLTFYLETPNRLSPFIFVRRRVIGFIPCAQLIYCRELIDLIQHGLAISTWLTMRGFPLMLIDASAPMRGSLAITLMERAVNTSRDRDR